KSINTRKITEALRSKTHGINSHLYGIAEEEISQSIEAVEITDD
ncbi:11561_t:CDS:1, partial [Gigaspora rosea]